MAAFLKGTGYNPKTDIVSSIEVRHMPSIDIEQFFMPIAAQQTIVSLSLSIVDESNQMLLEH